MARIISFVFLLGILLVIAALFFQVMAGFFVPLFLAVLLAVMFRPLHLWLVARSRGHPRLAAGATTLAILVIVLAPMLTVLIQAGFEAGSIARGWDSDTIRRKLAELRERTGLQLPPANITARLDRIDAALQGLHDADPNRARERFEVLVASAESLSGDLRAETAGRGVAPAWAAIDDAAQLQRDADRLAATAGELARQADDSALAQRAGAELAQLRADLLGSPWKVWLTRQANPSEEQVAALRGRAAQFADSLAIGGAQYAGDVLPDLLVGIAVMILALYYFLADGPAMIQTLMRLSPLDDRYEEQLLREFAMVSRAVVVATLLSALAQGILAGIGYFFAGIGSVALLTMLTMLFALIPFIGGAAVWIPCCLWLFLEGRTSAAIVLTVYCAVVVSMADNIIKPLVLQGQSNLHPLLALLSVLGGVKALGPIGIVVGPMVVAFLQTLLKMLQVELDHLSGAQQTKP
ncbi:MAG TPA: AI-2E family transporter [Pirellulales bacterium]